MKTLNVSNAIHALILVSLSIFVTLCAGAAVSLTNNSTYSQPFTTGVNGVNTNTQISSYGTYAWTDDVSVSGWHAVVNGASVTQYIASNAGSQNGSVTGLYLFRSSGNSGALGTIRRTGDTGFTAFGVQFTNNTGQTITALDISYIGQQWQVNQGGGDELTFQYSTNAASLNTGDWTTNADLSVKSVADSSSGSNYQYVGDGNITTTYQRSYASSITGLSIAPGESFWLRWVDVIAPAGYNSSTTNQALSIDNFSLTPTLSSIPEPGAYVALIGIAGLLAGIIARRQ